MNKHETATIIAEKPARIATVKSQHYVKGRHSKESVVVLLLLLPAMLMLFLFRLMPTGYAIVESFTHNDSFIGLENYRFLFQSPAFWKSLGVTVLFGVIINPVQIILALLLAVLLTQRIPLVSFWRTLIFIPAAIPFISSAIVWSMAFRPDGLFNAFLSALHLGAQPFLTSSGQALYCIMLLASWIGIGYWMVFLIAGLQDIPNIYREAAAIDGAGTLRIFFQIVLPLLRRPLAFVLVADTVANFLLFAPIQALTRGGPEDSTSLLMFDIFRQAYTYGDLGLAYSEATIVTLVMLIIVIVQFRLLQSTGE
jgi:multiple sugar transport system permease protein